MLALTVTIVSCRSVAMDIPIATSQRENRMPPWAPPQRLRLSVCIGSTTVAVPSDRSAVRMKLWVRNGSELLP